MVHKKAKLAEGCGRTGGAQTRGSITLALRILRQHPVWIMGFLLAAFLLFEILLPLGATIQIGADEGLALSKAVLYVKGFKFYSEVWNDQPLMHTFLIAQIMKHVSSSILGPRLLSVAFAMLLLASSFLISNRVGGILVATLTTVFLMASPGFLELSSSCMVEIPALAATVAALCLLLVGRRGKWHSTVVLTGVIFGFALHVKFNAALYLPLAILVIWLRGCEEASHGRTRAKSIAVLVGSLVLSFLTFHSLIAEGSYRLQFAQAWSSHAGVVKSLEYGSPDDHLFDWSVLIKNWDLAIPGILGVVLCLRHARETWRSRAASAMDRGSVTRSKPGTPITWKVFEGLPVGEAVAEHRLAVRIPGSCGRSCRMIILPVTWLGLTFAVFGTHKPWWTYYYVHNAVPLSCCAAIGVAAVWRAIMSRHKPPLIGSFGTFALCAAIWMGLRVYLQADGICNSPQLAGCLVLKEIEPLKPFTEFMFSDNPVYSFHAGIPLPPKLAVLSLKRLWAGDMTREQVEAELEVVRPGVILVATAEGTPPYQSLLAQQYRLIYEDNDHRLFALKEVVEEARRQPTAR